MSREQRGGDSTGTMDPGPEVGDSARASSSGTVPELSKGERREVEQSWAFCEDLGEVGF